MSGVPLPPGILLISPIAGIPGGFASSIQAGMGTGNAPGKGKGVKDPGERHKKEDQIVLPAADHFFSRVNR